MANDNLVFISNNVKGIQNKVKRLKIFEYLKDNLGSNGFVFLQETHSSINDEKKWNDDFKGHLFFSHGETNSCGVAIGYVGSKKIEVLNRKNDSCGRILLLEIKIDESPYILINLYNPNTETDQVSVLNELDRMISSLNNTPNAQIILGGDFNFTFCSNLEASGGNPKMKKKSLAKFIEMKNKFDLCDIWRIRNPNSKRFTFRQQHVSGFIQRRLDFFLFQMFYKTL